MPQACVQVCQIPLGVCEAASHMVWRIYKSCKVWSALECEPGVGCQGDRLQPK
jgi:hypothetical protein